MEEYFLKKRINTIAGSMCIFSKTFSVPTIIFCLMHIHFVHTFCILFSLIVTVAVHVVVVVFLLVSTSFISNCFIWIALFLHLNSGIYHYWPVSVLSYILYTLYIYMKLIIFLFSTYMLNVGMQLLNSIQMNISIWKQWLANANTVSYSMFKHTNTNSYQNTFNRIIII